MLRLGFRALRWWREIAGYLGVGVDQYPPRIPFNFWTTHLTKANYVGSKLTRSRKVISKPSAKQINISKVGEARAVSIRYTVFLVMFARSASSC